MRSETRDLLLTIFNLEFNTSCLEDLKLSSGSLGTFRDSERFLDFPETLERLLMNLEPPALDA